MKIYAYTVFIIMMILLFNIAGFNFTLSSKVATTLGILEPENYSSFSFWGQLLLLFGAAAGAGAIIGTIMGVSWTFILKGLYIMTPLTFFVGDLISILAQVGTDSIVFWILSIVIIPIAFAYTIALVEFWDGRD